jgi:radical SAM/Cys-rich protein
VNADGAAPAALPAIALEPTLLRRGSPLASTAEQRRVLDAVPLVDPLNGDFDAHVARAGQAPLAATGIDVLQLNLGKVCNQTCAHCHVDAGPERKESMSRATAEAALAALSRSAIPTLDLTGGAPELHPLLRWIITEARALGRHVLLRCNLTVLVSPNEPLATLPEFFAAHGVEVIASLPHYRKLGTDRQRGAGVYERSIEALQRLNALGYGRGGPLRLVLVTNPVGAFLPSGQASLEAEWKRELLRLHGIRFDALYTITNMPISRYLAWLESSGNLAQYLQQLVLAFNPAAARGVMCRTTLSVGWDGALYDCDFNQMLELPVEARAPRSIVDFDVQSLATRRIQTGRHCFGCTAGAGSSCGGSLA